MTADAGLQVTRMDDVEETAVYLGGLTGLTNATSALKWRKEITHGILPTVEVLTLGEISEQLSRCGSVLITVVQTFPTTSTIYQYGNYGAYWCTLGDIIGYA